MRTQTAKNQSAAQIWDAAVQYVLSCADTKGDDWRVAATMGNPYALDTCSTCGYALRPYNAKVVDWPGTRQKVSTSPPLCRSCYRRKRVGGEYVSAHVQRDRYAVVNLVRTQITNPEERVRVLQALGLEDM